MPLSLKQVNDICLSWHGHKQCRYLATGDDGSQQCMKLVQKEKNRIDKEVRELREKAKANGQDVKGFNRALGDNCQGYVVLRYLKQGYDVDKKKK